PGGTGYNHPVSRGNAMGLLKRLFGGKPDKDTARTAMPDAGQDAGRTIRYDPGLVDGLKDDHQELVAMYTALGERVAAGDFHGVDAALQEFKIRLEAHLLTENVRFYVYVEQSMADDEVNYELIRGFRKEMNSIARGRGIRTPLPPAAGRTGDAGAVHPRARRGRAPAGPAHRPRGIRALRALPAVTPAA